MSQEKVNKYKEQKANRKQILKKEKRNRMLAKIGAGICGLAIVGLFGFSIWSSAVNKPQDAAINPTAIEEYLQELQTQ